MWRNRKSNGRAAPPILGRHVMDVEQKARRVERRGGEIGVPGVDQVGRYRYASAYEGLRLRSHPGCVEISFLARGSQLYRVNGRLFWLRGGDQHVVFPGEPHDSGGLPEEKGILYWLVVRVDGGGGPLLFLDRRRSEALRSALTNLPARHFRADPKAQEMLEDILAAVRSRPSDDRLRLEAAQRVLRYLLATVRASRKGGRRVPSARIRSSMDYVMEHEDELPGVPQLARIGRLSLPRFQVRFREECGVPPREFVLRHKMDLAQRRLVGGGRETVTDLAFSLGFSSSQYFATVFRRFCGTTPSAFRARFGARLDEQRPRGA